MKKKLKLTTLIAHLLFNETCINNNLLHIIIYKQINVHCVIILIYMLLCTIWKYDVFHDAHCKLIKLQLSILFYNIVWKYT